MSKELSAEKREHMLHVLGDDKGKRLVESLFKDYIQDPEAEGKPESWKRFPEFLLAVDGLVREFGGHERAPDEEAEDGDNEEGEDQPNSDDEYDDDEDLHAESEKAQASDDGELDRVKAAIAKALSA